MKEIKIIIIATVVTCMILVSCAFAMPAVAESSDYYSKLTVVVNKTRIEDRLWVIECEDKRGNIWAFLDDEGTWDRGDIANLLMLRLNEKEEDDEIMEVYWEGYTENIESYFRLMGWRQ